MIPRVRISPPSRLGLSDPDASLSTVQVLRETHISHIMVLTPSTVDLSLGRVMRIATVGGMSEVVQEFDAYLRDERMLSASTRERYVGALEKFEAFLKGDGASSDAHLEAVTKAQLTAFVRAEAGSEDGPSRAVWNSRLAALRSFFDYLF